MTLGRGGRRVLGEEEREVQRARSVDVVQPPQASEEEGLTGHEAIGNCAHTGETADGLGPRATAALGRTRIRNAVPGCILRLGSVRLSSSTLSRLAIWCLLITPGVS